MEQQDLLQDVEQDIYFERASTGARFANLLIDAIGLLIFNSFIGIVYGLILVTAHASHLAEYTSSKSYFFENYLIGSISSVLYYTLLEGATKGLTLGKLITGTKAVKDNNDAITWKDAFIRSLCRIVPFEVFSGFGTPWHDTWSKTQVIKVRK